MSEVTAEISALETALVFARQGVHPSDVAVSLRHPNGEHQRTVVPITWGKLVDMLEIYAARDAKP